VPDYGRYYARYVDVIPEFDAFVAAVGLPPTSHIRVNTLKTTSEELAADLAVRGAVLQPETWSGTMLRVVDSSQALGSTVEHAAGHFYMQSASSALAAEALDARPGDSVLDLCAAPGSKTGMIAQTIGNHGCIAANEPNRRRSVSLVANLERLGATCAVATSYAGQNFPTGRQFDRVLVDAPCSGEGTWRGPNSRPKPVKPAFRKYLVRQQSALIRKGFQLLKPGGTMVYSTCTYAPEENEAIVDAFVKDTGAQILPLDIKVDWLPGLTSWDGVVFSDKMAMAARLYPHKFDSEGFFLVRLTKASDALPKLIRPNAEPSIYGKESDDFQNSQRPAVLRGREKRTKEKEANLHPEVLDEKKANAVVEYLEDYFGIPLSTFSDYKFLKKGDYVYAIKDSCIGLLEDLKFLSAGIKLVKPIGKNGFRPATRGIQVFGRFAQKRVRQLSEDEASRLFQGQSLSFDDDEQGFYILQLKKMVLGIGLARNKTLVAQLPRSVVEQVTFYLAIQ